MAKCIDEYGDEYGDAFERAGQGAIAAPGALLGGFLDRIRRLFRVIARRRRFKRVLDLEDRLLDDIGVNRAEVEWAARLPLGVNAAEELHRRSLSRRRREQTPPRRRA